ncbi:hypothetical protein N2152v2_010823 [Parachlorella kessleri]
MEAGAVSALETILRAPVQDHILSAAVWALGMLGSHSAKHAKAVAGSITAIAKLQQQEGSSEDLKTKSLLQPHLLVVLEQIGKAMAADPHTRSDFVQCGGLKFVQELGEAPASPFKEAVGLITAQFPAEIVQFYSPAYNKQLLSKLAEPPTSPEALPVGAVQA